MVSRSAVPCARGPDTAEVPVIYLSTTLTDFPNRQLGAEVGADSYLTHPVDPTALVATVRALLFAKEAHAKRRAANARFKAIFDSAPTGMAMLDGSLQVIEANEALCDMLGIDRAAAAGRPLHELVDADQPALLKLHAGLARNQHWVGVLDVKKDVGTTELEWRISPDPASDQFIAMATDVTEERLRETRQQAFAGQRTRGPRRSRTQQPAEGPVPGNAVA